jgi:prevent-host-death family protein
MKKISVTEANARLSELLDRAAAGEEIVVTRSGKPIARIAPLATREPRPFGVAKHWPEFPDDVLLAPLDEEDLEAADGAYTDDFGVSRRTPPATSRPRRSVRRKKPSAR